MGKTNFLSAINKTQSAIIVFQSVDESNSKSKNCTLEEQAIINIIKRDPTIKQEHIAIQINKSVRTVKNYMAVMQEKGLIERKNGKRNGEWIINI